jgi:hypothetical protein
MHSPSPRRDFSGDARLLRITAIALVIGALSTVAQLRRTLRESPLAKLRRDR